MKLQRLLVEFKGPDPDAIMRKAKDSVAILYSDVFGLATGAGQYHDVLFQRLYNENKSFRKLVDTQGDRYIHAYGDTILIGRLGTIDDIKFISFWNHQEELLSELLEPCLQELGNRQLIDNDTIISLPGSQVFSVGELMSNTANTDDVEDSEESKKMRELHLMRPEQKKQAMKELGLASGGNKSAWQRSSEQNKLVTPGQKWWAPTSESKNI